ncbi:MAG: PEGA domain-containing protein [Acidobacteria bacterium]|nr:MAG: PEGA domain-containing protein [Acidobacteriota bacterium]
MMRHLTWMGVLMAVLWLGGITPAQEEVDLGAAALQSRRSLEGAKALYDEVEFARAIQILDNLLADFDTLPQGTLPEEDAEIRLEGLKLRGLAYSNLGQTDAARVDFAAVLRQQPGLKLDEDLLSPKIIDAFEKVRKEVTGLLVVASDPPGAEVRMGGRTLGVTPLEPLRVAAGRYLLDVEKRGFAALREGIQIEPGRTTEREYALERNARSVVVITSPSGARVLVDDLEVGVTGGTPPPGYEIALLEKGLEPAAVSAPLVIPFLSAGHHVMRIEKPCYASLEADFEVTLEDSDLPLELETVVLAESRSSLSLVSVPPGAEVSVDDRPLGRAPLEVRDLCGEDVRVRMSLDHVGTWEDRVALDPTRTQTVRGDLKLTLASLGAVREVGVEDPQAEAWDSFLTDVLQEQQSYAGRILAVTADAISPAHLELFRIIQAAGSRLPVLGAELGRRLARETGADLFLVAVPASTRQARILLFGAYREAPDVIPVDGRSPAQVQELRSLLERESLRSEAWSGLLTIETAESDFPYVLRPWAGAPEGTSVLHGDRVRSVGGRPVVSRLELEAEFAGREPGSKVEVSVKRGGALVETVVVTAETPVFERPGGKDVLINKMLADLERLRRMETDQRRQNLAAMGVGLAYLTSGDPLNALSRGFENCMLAPGPGISRGSVDYLQGVSLEALGSGRQDEAAAAFSRAAGQREATLWRDDGPLVAPLAEARGRAGRR